MAVPSYISPEDLRERTTFPAVAALALSRLAGYILRATGLMKEYGTLPAPADLDDTEVLYTFVDSWTDEDNPVEVAFTLRDLFEEEMRTVVTLIVERLYFGEKTTAADAAGMVHEEIGGYSYSRASSGGSTGEPVEGTLFTDEIRAILARWVLSNEFDVPLIQRTDVFLQTPWFDDLNPLRGLVVDEILSDFVLRASQRTARGY